MRQMGSASDHRTNCYTTVRANMIDSRENCSPPMTVQCVRCCPTELAWLAEVEAKAPCYSFDSRLKSTGYTTTDYGMVVCCGVNGGDSDYSLVLQPDGKIVAGVERRQRVRKIEADWR